MNENHKLKSFVTINNNVVKDIKKEYDRIKAILSQDIEKAVNDLNTGKDSKCLTPIDFAFMSGRITELEKFLRICGEDLN